ncbi:hypothetical protein ACRPOS_009200 (plasmid) [Bartonella heixiaziensis]|uniref:hypothetical protein n=1 Tax=Bartonella heixiaziensis TaxID=1461000 RepID=UPI003F4EC27A
MFHLNLFLYKAIVLPQMTVSISAKKRKQTVRHGQSPFINDVVVSIKDPEEQILVNVALIFALKAAGIKVFLFWLGYFKTD